jgi:nitroimidazol reductase NimA-like FMN-containing flavoprotein (pyridoxamine 5'-phosphate oxidase superfamily)
LHDAVEAGDLNEVTRLLQQGVDVDIRDEHMWRPFMHAVFGGHLKIVEFLITNGADIDAQDNDGMTPLHVAAWNDSLGIAQLLMQHGANINVLDQHGCCPLFRAVNSIEVMKLLAQQPGADLTVLANNGWSLLHAAASHGCIEVVEWLLQHDADTAICNADGQTPLHFAEMSTIPNRAPIINLLKQHQRFRNLAVHHTLDLFLRMGLFGVERDMILYFFSRESGTMTDIMTVTTRAEFTTSIASQLQLDVQSAATAAAAAVKRATASIAALVTATTAAETAAEAAVAAVAAAATAAANANAEAAAASSAVVTIAAAADIANAAAAAAAADEIRQRAAK